MFPIHAEQPSPHPTPASGIDFLAGKGEVRALLRDHDWSQLSLGLPSTWPAALREAVRQMLDSPLPMFISWGPELEFLYNDPFIEILGAQHPQALGARFRDIWAEEWPAIGPLIALTLSGETVYLEDARFAALHRRQHGQHQQTEKLRYTFTCAPVRDDHGRVPGIYGTGSEVSADTENPHHSQVTRHRLNETLEQRMQKRTAQLRESETYVRAILETTYQYVGVLDLEGRVLDSNRASLAAIKCELKDIVGVPFWKTPWFTGTRGMSQLIQDGIAAVLAGKTIRSEITLRLPIGIRVFNFAMRPILDAAGRVVAISPEAIDITAEQRVRDELRTSEERWKLALEAAGDGVWDWDVLTNNVIFSAGWKALLGYGPTAAAKTFEAWSALTHPEDADSFGQALQACLNGVTDTFVYEGRARCKDGSWKWILNRGAVVGWDAGGRPSRLVGTSSDISERKRTEQENLERANLDSLTGLPNRRLFRDRLEQEVKKSHRTGRPIALLFIDLDRFKEVNDLFGHDAGDVLLKEAASRIRNCVRETDTVARLGGDEFTIILTQVAHVENVDESVDEGMVESVERVARKILDELARPFQLLQEVVHIAGSIGITLYPQDGSKPEGLVRNADQAMYVSKKSGRNRYSFFKPVIQQTAWKRLRLIGDLRHALAKGQLQLYFQPMVDLADGSIFKAEALLRWHHPHRGLVLPNEFIGLAEETGLINEIGHWVFKEAAAWSRRWSDQLGHCFQISINKSPVQFMDDSHTRTWPDHLKALGLAGSSISIEITEGVLLNASSQITTQLAKVQNAGMEVAIDDFGTGYSSMAYLKKFDVDYLKIDQSFVRDMSSDASSRAIAETIIDMAQKLGLKTIAEGVETVEQRDWLKEGGCDFVQGFLYSRPLPAESFEKLLLSWRAESA